MGEIVKTVGATGRQYPNLNAWLADVPANLVTADEQWTAELYKDADFVETLDIPSKTTDATRYIKITAPVGQRHSYLANTGVRIKPNANPGAYKGVISTASAYTIFEFLEIDCSGYSANYGSGMMLASAGNCVIRNNICHDISGNSAIYGIGFSYVSYLDVWVHNNIVYNIGNGGGSAISFYSRTFHHVWNNTVYNCAGNGINNACLESGTPADCYNNLCFNNGVDFVWENYTSTASKSNVSSDGTADDAGGTGNLISKTAANNFTNAGAGDFSLKAGADALGIGYSIGSTKNANLDIRGTDRSGASWDSGAYQKTAPVFKFRRGLSIFGSGIGKRQIIGA